jgi:glucokinase
MALARAAVKAGPAGPGLSFAVGVDIGGTKIAAGLVDANGRVHDVAARPTPGATDRVLACVVELIAELAAGADPARPPVVGVGTPGVIDRSTGSVDYGSSILPDWSATPVREVLARATGFDVVVENDARVMAYGEAMAGAGRGYEDALYVSVGTGIGGALVRSGALVHGPHNSAGELAHLLVPTTGAINCGCGKPDHLEAVVSGPAIAARYFEETGNRLTMPELVRRIAGGDLLARRVLEEAASTLGRALAGLLAFRDSSAIILGGGVMQIGNDFLLPVIRAFRAEAIPPLRGVPVLAAELGTEGPLIGAALLALRAGRRQAEGHR